MWVYQGLAKAETPTLSAMAQHRWPAFPPPRSVVSR
jgi:soluble lytic murein transglycosylase